MNARLEKFIRSQTLTCFNCGLIIIGMNKYILLIVATIGTIFLSGCGQPTGWLIKPVPLDESLQETIIAMDEGWFVSDKIVIVDIDGMLTNDRSGGFFGLSDNPVSLFIEKLDKAAADNDVRAIVLRINSPGGGVTASDIMHRRLITFRRHCKIPVIAIIEDVGASGAYYIACGSDRILAHPTSIVGSIGVIMQTMSVIRTLEWLGIDTKAVTSGPFKDLASPLKHLSKKDLAILQGMIDSFYKRFLTVVTAGRPKLSANEIKKLADGRIYTGEQAKENGLVDDLGYVDSAIQLARQMSKVQKVKIVIYHRPMGYRANVYSKTSATPNINLINISVPKLMDSARPQFLYLWTGKTFRD